MYTEEFYKYLHETYRYDDGLVYRKKLTSGLDIYQPVGSMRKDGYMTTKVRGKELLMHRLVWALHNKYLPKFIDHIDGIRTNNKIENLREATKAGNNQNAKVRKDNTSGVKGVYAGNRGWISCVNANGVQYTKTFKCKDEAIKHNINLRKELHKEYTNHG